MNPCVNVHSWLKMVSWTIVKDVFVCKDGFLDEDETSIRGKRRICV